MHASHSRSRRQGSNKGEDSEAPPLLASRVDEPRSEPYSRHSHSSHHTENHRTSHTSSRSSYDTSREASSSRGHHETDDWRPSDVSHHSLHDRYNYPPSKDPYHSGSRDGYNVGESRDSDAWSSHSINSGREWTPRYGRGRSTSSHSESTSWNGPSTYEHRTSTYDQWQTEDGRSLPPAERSVNRTVVDDRHSDRDLSGWRKEEQRDGTHQSWARDSGWESGRRDHRGKDWYERSWEPAATWSSNRGEHQGPRNQNGHRNHQSYKNSKGGKKGHAHNKQKRDWRTDDGNLNNWPKRDPHSSSSKTTRTSTKRRHPPLSSRSRSRSPAESHQSHRSSRGRSRSQSNSPKRKRRYTSPAAPHSRTPSQGGRKSWNARKERSPSNSPSPPRPSRDSHVARQRSLSSASSTSRSRSTSRSPAERPRAVHRLPPATSLGDIPLPAINLSRVSGMRPPRDIPLHRNGRNFTNGKHANRTPSFHHKLTSNAPVKQSSFTTMPPPPGAVIPTDFTAVTRGEEPSSANVPSDAGLRASKRGRQFKMSGFRPIGQTNSSVKKFFPADDEDDEVESTSHLAQPTVLSVTRSQPQDLAADGSNRAEDKDDDVTRSSLRPSQAFRQEHSDEPSLRRDVHRNSSSSPHQLDGTPPQAESQLQKPNQNDDGQASTTPPWPPQIPDGGSNEVVRPSTPSRESRNELYSIINQVGEGTFGKVYKARNTVTKQHVALKRIRMEAERDGFPVTAMREIKLLQSLRHRNIVRLYEMMVSEGSVYMVFEYMDHDLTGILSQTQFSFEEAHLKSLCQQMLASLAYLHHKGVIHRDIKGSNILINNRGELKLADFGLARFYQKRRRSDYTNRVITLWYRPPELLFGATIYGPEVDMWSAGCIMLELYTKKPIFQGNDEIHQLDVIYKIIGTPTPERWLSITDLPWYELVKPRDVIPNRFRELFQKWLSPAGLDLAEKLLAYDPTQRVTAVQALEAPYFTDEQPPPMPPVGLSTLQGEWHELETKRERAKKRRKTEPTVQ